MPRMNTYIPSDSNQLKLLVRGLGIDPYATISGGSIHTGIKVTIQGYDLSTVLCQLLEDYSKEHILNLIKTL